MDDVCSEAWLVADEIARNRGFAVDFLNRDDQEQLLSWLYGRLVRYADKSVRDAGKLDRDWDAEDANSAAWALARLLAAPNQSQLAWGTPDWMFAAESQESRRVDAIDTDVAPSFPGR